MAVPQHSYVHENTTIYRLEYVRMTFYLCNSRKSMDGGTTWNVSKAHMVILSDILTLLLKPS